MTRAAFISLALTQRRLSHGYREMAREEKCVGCRSRYVGQASRLVRDARKNLQRARHSTLINERAA